VDVGGDGMEQAAELGWLHLECGSGETS
jgi:hypothetical protein